MQKSKKFQEYSNAIDFKEEVIVWSEDSEDWEDGWIFVKYTLCGGNKWAVVEKISNKSVYRVPLDEVCLKIDRYGRDENQGKILCELKENQ